jgi:hypothetical protein
MPCKGGGGWQAVKDPKRRAAARKRYYAQRAFDFKGMRAVAQEANRIARANKKRDTHARRLKAASLRGKRTKKRGSRRAPF